MDRNSKTSKPTSIIIDITPNCIFRCQHCDLWQSSKTSSLSYSQAQIIIDKLHSWLDRPYLFFTGGEPLLNKDLPKIVKYAKTKNILCHINTNAFLLDQKLAQNLINSSLHAVSISLDSPNPSVHDHIRGTKNAFDHVLKAISYLQNSSVKVFINTVIMKDNVKDLEKLIKLASDQKVDGLNFQCLLPNLGSKKTDLKNNPLWPSSKSVTFILQKIISAKNPVVYNSSDELKSFIDYYQNPKCLHHHSCTAGINNFIINHQGDVRLCFNFPSIGNIFKTSPQTIWAGKSAQIQRLQIEKCQQFCKIIACNQVDKTRLNYFSTRFLKTLKRIFLKTDSR